MGSTMAEKILARASGRTEVKAGQYVTAKIDKLQTSNGAGRLYRAFEEIGIKKVWDPSRIVALCGRIVPARDIESEELPRSSKGL